MGRGSDFALLKHYQSVSAEFVRLALAGIGAIGILYTLESNRRPNLSSCGTRFCFVLALLSFGLAAAAGVFHRYYSTDSMAFQIDADRALAAAADNERHGQQISGRNRAFKIAAKLLGISAGALALGSMLLGFGFIIAICSR